MATDRDDVVLSLEDVEVYFEDNSGSVLNPFSKPNTVRAVDGVSLDIHENEVIALIGESGCGKTTLGKTAIGLQQPTGGSVTYRGQNVQDAKTGNGEIEIPFWEIRQALQIIHQDPGSALNPNRKVMASLESPLKKWEKHLSKADRTARVLGLLERVGMSPPEDYAYRFPHQLSGGEKQRVALIRALLMNPDVILADEAISALDVSLRIEMMDLMHELQEMFDTSFLFISHDFSNARYITEKVGGRIGVMYLGELVEIGPAEEVAQNPQHPYTKSLRWATPDFQTMGRSEEMPIRKIDVPDPVNPPSGCRFHTRCPEVIQPDGLDLESDEWGRVLDFRQRIENGKIDLEARRRTVAATDGAADAESAAAEVSDEALAIKLRHEFSLEGPLTQQRAETVLDEAIRALVEGRRDEAVAQLGDLFTTPCEQRRPVSEEVGPDHVAACLRHSHRREESGADSSSSSSSEAAGD
ncbi:ABC transporter ATP-binding protein [Natronorubrum halophilum]|uniref:ABC transporter ATP-binding protein n=1 Tax=Natronorubrum halophilum TaxID=1702106 RepID=UPI0030B840A3